MYLGFNPGAPFSTQKSKKLEELLIEAKSPCSHHCQHISSRTMFSMDPTTAPAYCIHTTFTTEAILVTRLAYQPFIFPHSHQHHAGSDISAPVLSTMIHPNNVTPNHQNSGGVIPSRNQISRAGLLSATTHERSPTLQVNSQIGALCNQSNMSARYSPIVPGATRRQGSITPSPGLQEETDATAADLSTSTRHNLPVDTLDFGDYPEVNDDKGISSPRATVETDIRRPNANSAPLAVSHAWRPSTTRNQAMESYSTLPLNIEVADNIHGLLGITSENRPLSDALSHVSGDQRHYVQVCMYVSLRQMLAPHLGAQSARDHVYGAAIQARSRHQIQEILIDPQHEAYTQTQDPEGRLYDYTPLTCMRRWMTNQSQPFKTKHLPPRFHEGASEAMASVVGFIRNLLKQERASLHTLKPVSELAIKDKPPKRSSD
ncbi:hypothetical protein PCASD_03982 [Puccinia coronata f. sp. avenae]|uniref:Uncharacterized protein n=1 Tax=Puccinia coronata f. sp. avenae TaxID=200324 RepID=A0A2N5V5F6_9BASI|nr:hypothetical protein PCASD_03982 [Puccinia coronata f. sp. avenae]